MIAKKISLRKSVPVVLFLIISFFMFSCETGSKKKEDVAERSDLSESSAEGSQKSVAPPQTTRWVSPVYVGGPQTKKILIDKHKAQTNTEPIRYAREDMINMTVPYVQRVAHGAGSQPPPPGNHGRINLDKEMLLVYLDKEILKIMLEEDPSCTGLIAIFATDLETNPPGPKHQTFILLPFDINEPTALASSSGAVEGYQRWPTEMAKLDLSIKSMVRSPRDSVDRVFTRLGIIK